MRYSSYRFIEVTKLPLDIEEKVKAAIATGTIRLIGEDTTGKQYVDGKELHKVLGLEHGIAGYVNVD